MVGCSSVAQLDEALAGVRLTLSPAQRSRMDATA
jgi:aryl-alcohol dehydrogenase-like predicted oxidoreductase